MSNVWEEALKEFDWGGGPSENKDTNKPISTATTSSSSKKSNGSLRRDTKGITTESVPKVVVTKQHGENQSTPSNQADIGRGRAYKQQQIVEGSEQDEKKRYTKTIRSTEKPVTAQEKLLGASMYPMGDLLKGKSERVKKPKSKVVMMTPQEKLFGASMYQKGGNRDPKKEMRILMGLDAGPTQKRAHQ
jgi:hypothetical protein